MTSRNHYFKAFQRPYKAHIRFLFHRNSKLALVEAILSVMPKIFFRKHQLVVHLCEVFPALGGISSVGNCSTSSSENSAKKESVGCTFFLLLFGALGAGLSTNVLLPP